MKNFKFYNILIGWMIFIIASVVYLMTIEPTASFWDCGEFISTAFKLEVGHPPGAPFFMILGRFFTLFANDVMKVALMINALSALASSFTILFLFWSITHLAKKFYSNEKNLSLNQSIAIIGSGIIGALAYAFSDTFWFSATEGEVYALSSLLTAIVFWAILKWENVADSEHANKWLILIAYLMGLSIGVHLLNLLAIPAIVFVVFYKKYPISRKNVVIALIVSAVILASIMYGIIPGIVYMASRFELLTVNKLGLFYNSGLLIYIILLLGILIYNIYLTHIRSKNFKLISILFSSVLFLTGILVFTKSIFIGILLAIVVYFVVHAFAKGQYAFLNTALLFIAVLIIGYSSFSIIMIRSAANPPMDQNDPQNLFNLLSYLNREQYGERPLFYGQYYTAQVEEVKDGAPEYEPVEGEYRVTGKKNKYVYDDRFQTLFPRMYSSDPQHIEAYKRWANVKGVKVSGAKNRDGKSLTKPTFSENLKFFFRYQVTHMYFRYFMWNFSGRQNDMQSHFKDEISKGNWISGINFIDEARLGSLENYPDSLKSNKAHNRYFMLPLLLGLIGLIFHYKYFKNDFWIVFLLFFFTGLAIVIYLNQTPYQPRERDYAYAGSFYAFSIWIGLGVMGLNKFIKILTDSPLKPLIITMIAFFAVPFVMASENWDDHDRSNRYTARDFAYNYLMSCDKNGIIFTNGDNDTFPLWYSQEVEGYRTDVRVINLSYLGADWYIRQMENKAYESEPIKYSITQKQYGKGKRDIIYVVDRVNKPVTITQALEWVASDDIKTKQLPNYAEKIDYIPSKNLVIPIDSVKISESDFVPKHLQEYINEVDVHLDQRYITKNHLMALDIINQSAWERPVYYAITVSSDNYLDFDDHFIVKGMTYHVAPVKAKAANNYGQRGIIDTQAMYKNLVEDYRWGGILEHNDIYLDENNRRMLTNYRNSFAMLAEALIKEQKYDSALITINRCFEVVSPEKIEYDYFSLPLIEGYYKLNQIEIANSYIKEMGIFIEDQLDYYLNVSSKYRKEMEFEIRLYLTMLQQGIRMTESYNQLDLKNNLQALFDKNIQKVQR